MKLYEINAAIADILHAVAEAEGEITLDQEAALDALTMSLEAKAENIALWIRETLAKADAVKAEEARLRARRTALENAAERAKQYLHDTMRMTGRERIDAELATITVTNNSRPTVDVDPDVTLPEWATRVTVSPDKAALLKAHLDGAPVPAGVTISTGTHLRIR